MVVVGIVYFTSDVWRTKIQSGMDQFSKWTPENIAKDPENYLNFCEQETLQAIQSLKANEISIAQSHGKIESIQADAKEKVRVGDQTVTELKDLYQKTEAANAWPCKWQGQDRDKDWMKRQITALYRQTEAQKRLGVTVEDGLKRLDSQNLRVQDAKTKAQEQLSEIKTNREMLKVNKITDELTNRLVSMKSVLQSTLLVASDTSSIINLDQLTADKAGTVDETEFEKIMGGAAASKPK